MSTDGSSPWSNPNSSADNGGSQNWGQPTEATPPGDEAWRSAPPPVVDQSAGDPWSSAPASGSTASGWEQPGDPNAAWGQTGQSAADSSWGQSAPSAGTDSWQQQAPSAGTNSWDQPAAGASTWQQPQNPSNSWDQPAGNQQWATPVTQGQPYNPYGGAPASPYPVVYAYDQAPVKKNGMVPLILSLAALLISLLLSWVCYSGYRGLTALTGTTDFNTDSLPPAANGPVAKIMIGMFGQLVPTIVGIVAFVLSILAMKDPTAKTKAIIALIVAIIAPIVSFIVWMALMMSIPEFNV